MAFKKNIILTEHDTPWSWQHNTKWSNPQRIHHACPTIPEIVGSRIYHHIPVSRRFGGMADDCFYFTSDNAKVIVISSPFQDLCGDFMLNIACTMGLSVWSPLRADLKCTHRRSSLSVFKCCLALLILSGKPEHKSSKSSFILMSQVLDLLKSEYWNGLELATFKGPSVHSACGADLGRGNCFFPCNTDASLALFLFTFFFFQPPPYSSHTSQSSTLPD